ncbi:membrane-associated protein, putative [Bodo saltans]|uniref:Membrane-associated protein, putative n=1 Tax=Bodo saltans TaxID=75058 RepID=A0A0S4JVW0_BODSA|nr:membrane-associated protein, putative [Bodo saltans]|eukprot:CUG94441.1 membrane-associated protein, putative [Bodo saltans]
MAIISGLDGSDAIQIIGIVLVATVILLIFIGILVCCCCSGDAKSQEKRMRAIEAQKRKYAPSPSSEEFGVLVFSVTHWPQLVEAASMHACGADMRLKQLIAKAATQHGAYYIIEGIISGLDGSDAIQIIGIVLIATVILLIFIGVLVCCCCSGDAKSLEKRMRAIEAQKRKYAPSPSSEEFGVLVFSVTRWPHLVEAASMHACGADMRLKQLIAKAATQHGAYYIIEGDNAAATHNRKIVVSREPIALLRVANDVYATTMLADFSNNIAANENLSVVYSSVSNDSVSPWSGLELLATLHHGSGRLTESNDAAVDNANEGNAPPSSPLLHAEGPVGGRCVRRYSDLTPDEVETLRSQSLATLNTDGAALVKKFALPPADTMKIPIPTSGRASATPYTAVIPLTPTHRTDLTPSGKSNSATPIQPKNPPSPSHNTDEQDMLQRIQERREQQLRQQQQQEDSQGGAASGAHPNEVLDTEQRQERPSQNQIQQQPPVKNIINSQRHTNQMPVAELDDEHTDVMDF